MVGDTTQVGKQGLASLRAGSPYEERQEAGERRQKQGEDMQSEQQEIGTCFALLTILT